MLQKTYISKEKDMPGGSEAERDHQQEDNESTHPHLILQTLPTLFSENFL